MVVNYQMTTTWKRLTRSSKGPKSAVVQCEDGGN